MQQLSKGTTYTGVTPGNQVTPTNLNALVDSGTLTNGAVIDQNDVNMREGNALTLAADTVLLGDSTQPDTAVPLKVPLSRLLLESQRNGTLQFDPSAASAGGLGAAYTVTLTPAATAYADGMVVRFQADAANAAAVTVAVNGLTAQSIKNRLGAALAAGDIASGQMVELVYDAGNGWFVLQASTPTNSVTAAQLAELTRAGIYSYQSATTTYASSSSDAYTVTLSPAPTSASLVAGLIFRFLVPNTNVQACKLILKYVSGDTGALDLKKKGTLALVPGDLLAGAEAVVMYNGTNFQLLNPQSGWDYIATAATTLDTGGLYEFTHNLGGTPTRLRVVLLCSTAQSPWGVNDELEAANVSASTGPVLLNWWVDVTNGKVKVAWYYTGNTLTAVSALSTQTALTNSSWKFKVYAAL